MKLRYQFTALALCGGLSLIACGGAKPAQEASKATPKPAAATPAAATPAAAAEKPKSETASAGEGETLTNTEAGVQFTVPKGWKTEKGDGTVTVTSPDDGVAMSIVVSPSDSIDKAIDGATGELDKLIKNPKIEQKAQEGEVNGLKTVSMNGTGELEGKPVAWDLSIVGSKKPLLIISIGTTDSIEKHGKDYQNMVNSIKPL